MSDRTPRRGISSWSISRPIGTIMLTSTLLVLGLVYVGRLPVDLLPRIVYPQVRVSVSNAGVEPIVLEETIAKVLESSLATTQGLQLMSTEINEGRVNMTLDFRYGTNVDFALQDAAKNVERVRARLPVEADPPVINKSDPSQMQIFQVAFSSNERDLVSLRQWIDQRLRPQILSVDGVASVDISGGLVREIQVEVDPERLRGFGLTVNGLLTALRNDNQNIAGGRVSGPDLELVSRTTGKFETIDDIRNTLLTGGGGTRVPLRDVAIIRDTSQEQRFWARLNGVPAVRIGIQKQPEANTVEVVDGVKALMERLAASQYIPTDIAYKETFDQSGFIRDALNSVKSAAIMGAILAMIVVMLFLRSFRKTFIIGVSIPLAVLATFIMMGVADLTLNIMSLGGLALGTGLLLDNAIVMLENIYRRRTVDGLDPEEGAHVGAAEVSKAIIAATTTNLASVAPFLLITGLSALIFRELILTISFAILASLPLALTLVAMLAAQLGKVRFSSGLERFPPLVAFDRFIKRVTQWYRGGAARAVRWRFVTVGAAVAVAVAAVQVGRGIPNEFLPNVDDGTVGAFIRLPAGATPQQTDRLTRELEAMVREMPDVESVFATAGGFLFGGSGINNAGRGSLDVRLSGSSKSRQLSSEAWVREMQRRIDERGFAGARVGVRPPRIRGLRTSSSGEAVSVAIVGDELEALEEIGRSVARTLQGTPGLQNFDFQADEQNPLLSIELDRERARTLGLDVNTVGQTIRTALDGTIATRYAEGNFEYDVRVFFPRGRFQSVNSLADLPLFPASPGRAPVQLRDVAFVGPALGPSSVRRVNQNRQIQLSGDVLTSVASISTVTDSIRSRLASLSLPDGYGVIIGGEAEAIEESNAQMLLVVGLAVFLVFVVLAVQYESLTDPFVILAAVPMSLVGVVGILKFTGIPFSAPALLGMILLAGIVVNNSILLVEFVKGYRATTGASSMDAVVEAGAARLRPILMTTITSLVGTAPLALGLGDGSELMRPLAIAVVGGLSISTLLTLFVVPCLYVIMHAITDALRRFVLGPSDGALGAPTPQPVAGD
jgi:hydrophobe/amphiphile efflux-1 (HAE1) family protein